MIEQLIEEIILFIAGLGSGIFVGIASGTAASIVIPTLTVFAGYTIYQSIGTSLFVDCIIGAVAGIVFLKKGNVELKPTLVLVVTGVIGALIGSLFTSSVPEMGLNILIGAMLLFLGINFMINGVQKNIDYIEEKLSFDFIKKNRMPAFVILGLFVGFLSGFIGMGSSGTFAIILIFILGYNLHTAIGTSLVMMSFIAGIGATGHLMNDEVVLPSLVIVGTAAAIGAFIGSSFANKIDENKLGRAIGVVVTILGVAIFAKIFF